MTYDSRPDTLEHIRRVQSLLDMVKENLAQRAVEHDKSKLESPEKEAFDRETPLLRELTYGSPEYKDALSRLGEALTHHYANNDHHPEFDKANGINGMSLMSLMEMLADWKAATQRHNDGDIHRSLEINSVRFDFEEADLTQIFWNTLCELGWA